MSHLRKNGLTLLIFVVAISLVSSLQFDSSVNTSEPVMGLEIFVQFFEGGEAACVSVEAIAGAFGSHLEREGGEWRRLRYGDAWCEIFANEAEGAAIDGFMVSAPLRDQRLWEDLVRVLRLGHGVLYWASENPTLIVADAATATHLPTEMVEGMGGVTVVSGGAGVMKELEAR